MELATNIADTARKTNSYVVSFIHILSATEITNKNSEFYELLRYSNIIFLFLAECLIWLASLKNFSAGIF
jgi:hypothetical protein